MEKNKINENKNVVMDKLVSLCKRRGFIFQSSEIYGGINSCWDYGPLGVELKKNIKDQWWRTMTLERDDVEGLDASILMHPKVWEASGHVAGFTDPLVDCKNCKNRYRPEQLKKIDGAKDIKKYLVEKAYNELMKDFPPDKKDAFIMEKLKQEFDNKNIPQLNLFRCPNCGDVIDLTIEKPRQFNLMFKTFMGPVEGEASIVYLRPETAQGIYVNFLNVWQASRQKIPFGIAQIGKAFRNEITPGNFIFRTREFEQMEMQFFVKPGTDMEWFEFWKKERIRWYEQIGIQSEKLRFHQHEKDELAHYAKAAFDIEFEFPFGWNELEGIHNRSDFDLSRHKQYSGKDLSYYDEESKERFIPYIIETSAGADRTTLAVLTNAYMEEPDKDEIRTVMKFHPRISPLKAAILPLVKRDNMPDIARKIYNDLRSRFKVFYDESGSIGRRYRRQDEAGTPFCITVDSQTLQDDTVTVRDRDSMDQVRYKITELQELIQKKIS